VVSNSLNGEEGQTVKVISWSSGPSDGQIEAVAVVQFDCGMLGVVFQDCKTRRIIGVHAKNPDDDMKQWLPLVNLPEEVSAERKRISVYAGFETTAFYGPDGQQILIGQDIQTGRVLHIRVRNAV
jgi:hypothetical protein